VARHDVPEVENVILVAPTDGYGPWPQLLDWCLEPSTLASIGLEA
jgi:hypothetical protein